LFWERDNLLFLKKKKQKDFCSWGVGPHDAHAGSAAQAARRQKFLLLFLQKTKGVFSFLGARKTFILWPRMHPSNHRIVMLTFRLLSSGKIHLR
jgi:hypothetical protein